MNAFSFYSNDEGHVDVRHTDYSREVVSMFRTEYEWIARPVWVIIGDIAIPGSLHNFPHSQPGVLNPDGHLCIHFTGTVLRNYPHTAGARWQQHNSQNAVTEAIKAWENPIEWRYQLNSDS